MVKKSVYIETSIISYLTARPSRDLLAAAWQKVTIDWWETQRDRFDLYTSDLVTEEAGRGDDSAVSRRLEALDGIPLIEITMKASAGGVGPSQQRHRRAGSDQANILNASSKQL